jgi:DNA-binding SARP family transcriptional activator
MRDRIGMHIPQLHLVLLGGFEARGGTGSVLPLQSRKTQALVAYLAVEANARHGRSKLAALFWGDVSDQQARDSLRHALSEIRRVLRSADASGALVTCGDSIAFDAASIDVDVTNFEQLISAAAASSVQQAIRMYRGELLDGIAVDEEPFEQWLAQRRLQLRAHATSSLAKRLDRLVALKEIDQAIETAQWLLEFDRANEAVHRTLMQLYVAQGRRGTALQQYQSCAEALQRELGVDPDAETRKAYESILRDRTTRPADRESRCSDRKPVSWHVPARPANALIRPGAQLVGRAAHLDHLRAALDAACRGVGGCVVVTGEGGVGKSALVGEAAHAAQAHARVLEARAVESERALAFGMWVDALRSADVSSCCEAIGSLEAPWQRELARLIPDLVPYDHDIGQGNVEERQLFEAVLHLLLRFAAHIPLVLVLEDLHWADEASVRMLAFIVRRIASTRMLIITTLRDEEVEQASTVRRTVDELVVASLALPLEVGALSDSDTFALVRRLACARQCSQLPVHAATRMWEMSQGNPFLITEMMRAMHEGATLDAAAALRLSERVRQVVDARIQRFADPVRAVLAVAAVVGSEFEFTLIVKAADLSPQEVAGSIEELVRRRILHVIDDRFDFTHAWIREVVYEALLPSRRELLHAQVAIACEEAGLPGRERLLSTLVHHYSLAKVWHKAALYARRAGEQALQRCAYSNAASLFEKARLALEHLPENPDVAREMIDVRVSLHRSLLPTGIPTATIVNLTEAERLLRRVDDDLVRRAKVLLCVSEHARNTGRYEQALDAGRRALRAARDGRDRDLASRACFHLGFAQFWKGEYRRAISIFRQGVGNGRSGVSTAHADNVEPVAIPLQSCLALALASIGDFDGARKAATEAMNIADEIDDPFSRVGAWRALGLVLVEQGDFDTAVPLLERSLRLCEEWHMGLLYSLLAGGLGYAYAITGQVEEGVSMMQRAVRQRESLRGAYPGPQGAYVLTRLAEGLILAQRLADAAAFADRAANLARTYDNRIDEAWALRLYGDLAAQQDPLDVENVQSLYDRSRRIAAAQQMAPFVAHCDLRIGKLHLRSHEHVKSRTALRRARNVFARLDMPFWARQADEALAGFRSNCVALIIIPVAGLIRGSARPRTHGPRLTPRRIDQKACRGRATRRPHSCA